MSRISKRRLASLASASVLIATVAVASVPAMAMAAGPAPKATGDVYADRSASGQGTAHMVFVAQGTSPAKGTFTYSDGTGGTYTMTIQDVKIDGATAHFAGPVVSSSYPGVGVGSFVGIAVFDGGEPGIDVDLINGQVYGSLDAATSGYATLSPDFMTASAGNVQVH